MSKKKTKSRRAYDPGKARRRAMEHFARKCYLYRWESVYGHAEFTPVGPERLPQADIEELMEFALARPRQWVVYVIACFVTGDGEYYEECREFVSPQLMLSKEASVMDELIRQAADDAKGDGNPRHFVDTCVVLRLDTNTARQTFEDDDWAKRQAVHRAEIILETWREGRAAA